MKTSDKVFGFFKEIAAIPRPSGKEEAITDMLLSFAKDRGLECMRDPALNVIIKKPATKGMEGHAPVILQGHTDMVCEHISSKDIDMDATGITVITDGDNMYADGTTLGADNGIGMAMMMAALDSEDISHPPLECLFTATEETGMDGARGLDMSALLGRRLINLDSEEEGFFIMGCAGGGRFNTVLEFDAEPSDSVCYTITIDGLAGGHSGTDINNYSGNSSLLLVRMLSRAVSEYDIKLISLSGGSKDNAIPRSATASIMLPTKDKDAVISAIKNEFELIKKEFHITDPDMVLSINEATDSNALAINANDSRRALAFIRSFPNGVQRMSRDIEGIVETSLNLGIMSFESGRLSLSYSLRSSVAGAYADLKKKMQQISDAYGAKYDMHGEYPSWEYNADSKICRQAVDSYKKLYKKEPIVTVLHAGLECGLFKTKLKELDMVSLGPAMKGVHSPSECLSISSTERTWELLCDMLSSL